MTCITHCDQDVDYRVYEFPHGSYLLPYNSDDTIHRCSFLRDGLDDFLLVSHNQIISHVQLYGSLLYELEGIDVPCTTKMHYDLKNEKDHEHYTENDAEYQIIVEFLKKLFLINHICPDPFIEEPPNNYPVNFGAAAIIGLIALLYHDIGDENSYKKAQELEKKINLSGLMYDFVEHDNSSLGEIWKEFGEKRDGVTNEMTVKKSQKQLIQEVIQKIFDNYNSDEIDLEEIDPEEIDPEEIDPEETEIVDEDDEKYSLENLVKYRKKVESEVKSFLRSKISEPEIKKYYAYCYNQAIYYRKNNAGFLEREFDDVIEFLTFGHAVSILGGKIDREIKDQSIIHDFNDSNLDFHIEKKYFNFLHLILNFRDDDSHYSQVKTNNSMHLYERKMIYFSYTLLMDFFKTT